MDITIDRNKCCGYGICVGMCPQVFRLDDTGFAEAIDGDFPADVRKAAVEAAEACPELAITVQVSGDAV